MSPLARPQCAILIALGLLVTGGVAAEDSPPWSHTLLKASDGVAGDEFGWALAFDSTTALIGAIRRAESGKESGTVYVFERSGDAWRAAGKLAAWGVRAGAWFGMALSLAGGRAAVGAGELMGRLPAGGIAVVRPGKAAWSHTAERLATGSVYVFQRHQSTWSEETRLVGSRAGFGARFGSTVAIDGDRLAVGAPGEGEDAGAVYVFRHDSQGWHEEARLLPEGMQKAEYGRTLALHVDTLAVGTLSGRRVDLFRLQASGWRKEASLGDPAPAAGTGFGLALSLRAGELLVGAPPTDDNFPVPPAAYLFRREAGAWRQVARLDLGNQERDFSFARAVVMGTGTASVLGSRKVYRFRAQADGWRRDGDLELSPDVSPQIYTRALAAGDATVLMGASLWGGADGSTDVVTVFEQPAPGTRGRS
jgi:hypothetical protein